MFETKNLAEEHTHGLKKLLGAKTIARNSYLRIIAFSDLGAPIIKSNNMFASISVPDVTTLPNPSNPNL